MKDKEQTASLLSEEAAIVQMPGREFPGLVVAGDTMRSWYEMAEDIITALRENNFAEATDGATYLSSIGEKAG